MIPELWQIKMYCLSKLLVLFSCVAPYKQTDSREIEFREPDTVKNNS